MTVVNNQASRADGSTPSSVVIRLCLAGTNGQPVIGYLPDKSLVTPLVLRTTGAAWSADLVPNSSISPSGTRWKVVEEVDGHHAAPAYLEVPATGGPYQMASIFADPPASLPTLHSALTTSAHGGLVASTDARLSDQRVPTDASVTGPKLAETITDATRKIKFDFEFFRARGDRVHVVSKGADPTGVADSRNALNNSQLALPTSGGEVQLGIGTYTLLSSVPQARSNIRWKGDHPDATIVRAGGAITRLFTTNVQAERITFEDLTLDGADLLTDLVLLTGLLNRLVTFRRVRFTGLANPAVQQGTNAVNYSQVRGLLLEDCEWNGKGTGDGRCLLASGGGGNIRVVRPRVRYVHDGFIFDTGLATSHEEVSMSGVFIDGADMDLGWFLLLHQFAGEGGTVTYANPSGDQIVLTDTAAAFSGLTTTPHTNIRVMPVLATGTIGNTQLDQVRVTGSGFVAADVRRGDIIRCGTAMAVVEGRESDSIVRHEGWLSDTDRSPVTTPALGTAYTIYRTWIGRVTANTATTATIDRLHDFRGNTILPPTLAAGTRYEILRNRPNYPIYAEPGLRRFGIYDGTLRRGWSDQIGIQGARRGEIAGMHIIDGQDVGVTLDQVGSVLSEDVNVHDNHIEHQGTAAVYIAGRRHKVHHNTALDTGWTVSPTTAAVLGDFTVVNGKEVTVEANEGHLLGEGVSRHMVFVSNENGETTTGTRIRGNRGTGHSVAQYRIEGGALTTGTKLRDNEGTVSLGTSVGTVDFGLLRGTGSPEGVVLGSIGNRYERSDGGAGTSLWVKETGNNTTTGWVALDTAVILTGSAVWDPPSFASGVTVVTLLTVTGVAAGDLVEAVSLSSIGGVNVVLTADVQGTDTVRVKLMNLTGVSQDLPSGTVRVRVRKAS